MKIRMHESDKFKFWIFFESTFPDTSYFSFFVFTYISIPFMEIFA